METNDLSHLLNSEIFPGKTLSELLSEIYQNARKKDLMLKNFIEDLKSKIKNLNDINFLTPLIQEYLDLAVKNDEQLIKLAALVQRLYQRSQDGEKVLLSESEKNQLNQLVEEYRKGNSLKREDSYGKVN